MAKNKTKPRQRRKAKRKIDMKIATGKLIFN